MFVDSSDSLCLLTRMQQCILVESSPHSSIHLFTMYFMRAYSVPVTSAGARRSEETFFTSTVGLLPCRGSWVGSEIAYVINQSYYSYSYQWFLTNRNITYGSMKTTWKMSLINCSLESPFSSVHDIYCQGDHNPVSPKGARHRQPWTRGRFAHRWQLQGRRVCFRVR